MNRVLLRGFSFAAIWVALVLAACNATSAPSTDAPPVPADTRPVAITLWHAYDGNARSVLNSLIADFQKAYPWITVTTDAKNSDSELVRYGYAAIALNQPPDVLIASPRTLADFARRGALVSFDAFLTQEKIGFTEDERADFFPGMLDAGKFPDANNAFYAFPFDLDAVALYYNSDLLQAAKISAPPKTWDEFSAAARAATRGDVRGWAMTPNASAYAAMLYSRGGSVLDPTQAKIQFNDDTGQKTIQFIAGLTRGGAAYIAPQAREDFIQGKTALYLGSTDELNDLADAMTRANRAGQWSIAFVPQNDLAHPIATVTGNSIAIFRSSDERARAAWLCARWLAAPEQTARWSRATLSIPSRISALNRLSKDAATNPLGSIVRGALTDGIPAARALPSVNNAAQIDAAFVEMWTMVGNGTDPNVALNRAVARASRALGQ